MLSCNSYVWRIIAVSSVGLYSSARPPAPQSPSSQLLHRPSNWALFSHWDDCDVLKYRFFLSDHKYSQMCTQNNNVAEKHDCWAGVRLLKKKKAGLINFKCNKSSTPAHLCPLVMYLIRFNKKVKSLYAGPVGEAFSLLARTLLQAWCGGGVLY